MIESGLYVWVTTQPLLQTLLGQSPAEKAKKVWSCFYFSDLPKASDVNTPIPGIVLDVLKSTEEDTLDARGAGPPWGAITRVFQFGCVASDAAATGPQNPWSPSGYLSAAFLALVLYRLLMAMVNFPLPDGSIVQSVSYVDEYDGHYQVGNTGYVYRRILTLAITYVPSPTDPKPGV